MGWIEDKIEAKLGDLTAAVADEGQRTRYALSDALAQSIRGLRIDGARPRPVSPNAANATAGGRLVGWSLRATGGDATVTFHDGDLSGDVIATTPVLSSGQADTRTLMPAGVSFVQSLYVEVTSTGTGTVTGAVWFGAVD